MRPQTIGALLDDQADARGEHAFLRFGGADTTYAEMATSTTKLANALLALGVEAGDRLGIMCGNRPEFLQAWFATTRIGVVEVPINVEHRGRFLSYALGNSEAAHVVIEAELVPHLAAVIDELPELRTVIVVGDGEVADLGGVAVHRFDDLVERGSDAPVGIPVDVRDTAVIGYTSGTTGPSKGVMMSHKAAWYAADDARAARGLTADDVFFTTLPLFHLNAQHLTTLAVLIAGATLALEPKFSASAFWGTLRSTGATHFNFIGAMLAILAGRPPSEEETSERPRIAFGAPLTPDVLDAGANRWNLRFLTGYGATEAGIITYAWADEVPGGSFGVPSSGFQMQLVDDAGEPVPDGTPGEIVTRPNRADSMMTGYWRMPEKTVEAWRDLWFHTGDMARRDADGWFWFVDRKKDALRRRGENISSTELEGAVREYPAIAEVAVIGVPSPLGEDDVKTVVRLRDPDAPFDHAAFLAWCEGALPKFMIPRYVEVVADFPRTPTQRIEKYKLREQPLGPTTWDRELGGFVS